MKFAIVATLLVLAGIVSAGPVDVKKDIKDLVREELQALEQFIKTTESKINELINSENIGEIEKLILTGAEALLEQLEARIEEIEQLLGVPKAGLNPFELVAQELRIVENLIIDVEESLEAVRQQGTLGPIANFAIDTFESVLRFVEQQVENIETLFGGARVGKPAPRNIRDLLVKELELLDQLIVKVEGQVEAILNQNGIGEITKTALNLIDTLLKQVQAGVEELEKELAAQVKPQDGDILSFLKETLEELEGAILGLDEGIKVIIESSDTNFLVKIALQGFEAVLINFEKAIEALEKVLFP